MLRFLQITAEPIDEAAQRRSRPASTRDGATLQFLGIVRDLEDGAPIVAIRYEAFEDMARHQFELLFDEIERRWPVSAVRLVHRTGVVRVGEPSLWVEVTAGHRGEAFAACQYLIDRMKETVPIWKHPVRPSAETHERGSASA